MARAFASIGAQSILGTRIDMARRLGGLLSAAHHGGLSFCNISTTSRVADGLDALSPQSLAGLLMPGKRAASQAGAGASSSGTLDQDEAKATSTPRTRIKQ